MLIKQADDQAAVIAALERISAGTGTEAKRAAEDLRLRKAGLKGEAESAYLIDFEFAQSRNWAVIHDLRLEHGGRVAQIDHLLINRWMDIYVLETKHFHSCLKITEDGEFLRLYMHAYQGMASPLEQNERHIAVLRDVLGQIELPMRLGVKIPPSFSSLIMVSPSARIIRPKRFDTSRVIKADQLKKRIWKDIDDENPLLGLLKTAAKIVSSETVEYVARQLAAMHRPLQRGAPPEPFAPGSAPNLANRPTRAKPSKPTTTAPSTGPSCKTCRQTAGEILYGKYGYYFKCGGCQGNTAIRFTCQPGHQPRLRKEGLAFYRECADCGSSALFHRNTT